MVRVIDRAVLVCAFRKREREREGAVYVLLVLLFFIFIKKNWKLNQINYRWFILISSKVVFSYSTWSHLKVSKAPLLHLKNISRCLQLHSKAPSSTMHGSKRPALPVSTRRLLQLFFSFSFFLFLFTFSSTSTFADISVDNPATGKCCGTISALTAVSANAALEAAKSAAEGELHTCIFIFHVFNMYLFIILGGLSPEV